MGEIRELVVTITHHRFPKCCIKCADYILLILKKKITFDIEFKRNSVFTRNLGHFDKRYFGETFSANVFSANGHFGKKKTL